MNGGAEHFATRGLSGADQAIGGYPGQANTTSKPQGRIAGATDRTAAAVLTLGKILEAISSELDRLGAEHPAEAVGRDQPARDPQTNGHVAGALILAAEGLSDRVHYAEQLLSRLRTL